MVQQKIELLTKGESTIELGARELAPFAVSYEI